MGLFDKISFWIRSLSDYRQPVYDPNYDGSNWRKWLFVLCVLIVGLIVYFIVSSPQTDNANYASDTKPIVNEAGQESSDKLQLQGAPYEVLRVIDGDTIDIKVEDETRRVRLIGVDTPEKNHPSKPVECFANEASVHLSELLSKKRVDVEADNSQDTKDKYNRYLYYIHVDEQNINKQMIADGYAYEYTYNTPYKYQNDFKQAQLTASDGDKGLWSPSSCNGERVVSATASSLNADTTPSRITAPQPSDCDSNYSPCVPNVSHDLDCGDISFSVRVIGSDHHRFDRNGDGYGCESNG